MVIDFGSFYDFPHDIDALFQEMMRPNSFSRSRASYPQVNISEDSDALYIDARMPGVKLEDIDLEVTENDLVLKGERKAEEAKYYRQERGSGQFQRVFHLSSRVDHDGVKATLRNGILEIVLPKAEAVKPRKIAISA
ncbi:Hsp20/alpha crystallin family protein [Desulfobaculum bizertense]|uniref:HSP20 family protein n=1 Tax=Desulfobaculum bizertense DSM 18034 TaxID=1121442 RepID=A0A1T4VCX1_9BACT|nr:Hsp20/alpha crystallin family protein [Desulfobaculum bizertense]UIJ37581.1 Hsp20/alpha crystallin family protein [Desulfobaculum bizertense]SKA62790.1 HSP20 family protein [Desulfobaculum bizertense DSM 18034]